MPPTGEPFEDVSIFARLRWWMRAVQELGAWVHLTGDGGDAVLAAPPAYLADLVRHARSSELWRHAAGWARLRHRPVHRLVGAARRLAHSTQASAIEHYASVLEHHETRERRWEDLIGWLPTPACPQWFTGHARALAATALREASREFGDDVAPGDATSLGVGDYSMLAYRGLFRHRRTVVDLLTNSRLADLGLIDEKAIRADLARGAAGLQIPLAALDQVLGAEIWLRADSTSVATVDHRAWAHA